MKTFLLTSLSFIFYVNAIGQSISPSTFNAAGQTGTIGGIHFETSIGEMVAVHTASTSSIIVTHGILQPNANSISIQSQAKNQTNIEVYPNASSNEVYIHANFKSKFNLSWQIIDVVGKVVKQGNINREQGELSYPIDVKGIAVGCYYLQIQTSVNGHMQNKSFKIEKI